VYVFSSMNWTSARHVEAVSLKQTPKLIGRSAGIAGCHHAEGQITCVILIDEVSASELSRKIISAVRMDL